jgi:hypothetical protein
VLNANYMLARLKEAYDLPFDRLCMHEFVLSARSLKREHGITALDVDPLLIPADRLCLLGQRGAEPGEGAGLRRQLVGWLVVLVESHPRRLPAWRLLIRAWGRSILCPQRGGPPTLEAA